MSEESARGEGSSPARAGEAARQLIRRTRQVTRRKFPAEEKVRSVLEGVREEVAVSELYRRDERSRLPVCEREQRVARSVG